MNTSVARAPMLILGLLAVLAISACGGGGGGPSSSSVGVTPKLALFAGNMGGAGTADGPLAVARFSPWGVAVDSAGNIYVADAGNHTIRKITPDGVVSTLAGVAGSSGSADGTGAAARFNQPNGVATDGAGNIYVGDTKNYTIRKITPAGVVSTLAGMAGQQGSADGTGSAARFWTPASVATDSAGNVYVADPANCNIRKVTSVAVVSTLAGVSGSGGSADGTGAAARFSFPLGIATDGLGNVYVADSANCTVRKITPAATVSTLAGTAGACGSTDGTGAAARFLLPIAIGVDSLGNLYLTDYLAIRKITPAGVVSTFTGSVAAPGSSDGVGAAARFKSPSGIATDSAGNVYVADTGNYTIRKIDSAGAVVTLAGGVVSAMFCPSADGIGVAASFCRPEGVATDSAGNVYVADTGNDTVRKITPEGMVSTFAGVTGQPGSSDGAGTAAGFSAPEAIATDSLGNVYVADSANCTVRKITPTGMVSTLAGTAGACGSTDATGAAARFSLPVGIAIDSLGNVYVSDADAIRKITPGGMVSTLAGVSAVSGSVDGAGASARFNGPRGIAIDSANNLYVADTGNSTIRKITQAGVVTTVVGMPAQAGFAPGELPGLLAWPTGVAISGSSLYITLYNGVAIVQNLP